MKAVLIALLFVSVGGAHNWSSFKSSFKKTYTSASEEQQRKENFLLNSKRIKEHNTRYFNGEETYWLDMNEFGDWSDEELSKRFDTPVTTPTARHVAMRSSVSIPDSIDWNELNVVSPPENQGDCNCGWAFSAAGAIEGQMGIRMGERAILSKQNLLDCSGDSGTSGCGGGATMQEAFSYVQSNGINSELAYPYTGIVGSCSYNPNESMAIVAGFMSIDPGNEIDLQQAVAEVGPIAAGMDGNAWTFKFYKGGIYNSMFCNPDHTNHAVLITGYGSENGTDYWIAKNSWGTNWGEKGFFRLSRNDGNMCGIATLASYPYV